MADCMFFLEQQLNSNIGPCNFKRHFYFILIFISIPTVYFPLNSVRTCKFHAISKHEHRLRDTIFKCKHKLRRRTMIFWYFDAMLPIIKARGFPHI